MGIHVRAAVAIVLMSGVLMSRGAFALDDAARDRILTSQTRLAATLLTRLPSDPMGAVMVSPASLAGMLSPLTIAGDEAHRATMARVLQVTSGSTQLDDLDSIQAVATRGASGEAIEISTRYIFAPRSPPTAEAARSLAQLGVEAIVAEPTSAEVKAGNDAWVSKVTHGKITEVNPPPPDTALAALNALHFKGEWAAPFKQSDTGPADFHTADGGRVRAPFMHSRVLLSASREDIRFVAVDMPFADARYAMVVLTTKDEPANLAAFADHFAWLDGQQFQTGRATVVDLPRFKASSQQHLLEALLGLGLDASQASSGLTTAPAPLAEVGQTVKLDVDEEGAEAAALTDGFEVQGGVVFRDVSEVIVDKPFAFALRDRQTGLVIAAGFVSRVDGEKLAKDVPTMSARSQLVMDQNEEQRARAAAQGPAKVPPSPDALAARMNVERDF